jgi:alkylation response protein AidB-like acyl-CoA dehydrogenase
MKHSGDLAGQGGTGAGDEHLARARALAPEIEASASLIERERQLPRALVQKLVEAGLFRMLLPRSLDGGEVDPVTFVRVLGVHHFVRTQEGVA